MQQFLLLTVCFLGLIFSDFGPSTTRAVVGKTTFPPLVGKLKTEEKGSPVKENISSFVRLIRSSSSSSSGTSDNKSVKGHQQPPSPPPPQSLAQIQNDASYSSMSMQDICASFTNGSHFEFYSPLYPSNYMRGIDCYKIISAGPGQVIRIKFLDHFHIEHEENCNYDFLEIRDGRYGYSTLIGNKRICGTSPPPIVQSSGRHLWLRFHADNDIEYIGFKAVYEFVSPAAFKPDLDECFMTSTSLEGTIGTVNISLEIVNNARAYEVAVDCTWMIHAAEGERIYLTFDQYELEKFNDCTYNFIEIYGPHTELTKDSREKQYCGSRAEPHSSTKNILYIRFFSMLEKKGSRDLKSKFQAYYNFYRDSTVVAPCQEGQEIDCNDNTCIDRSLKCNGKNNCKLSIDEENCPDPSKGKEKHFDIIVIASLGCVLIAGMCGGLFLNIYRKLRQDRKDLLELKEALRKSRESQLAMNQIGLTSSGAVGPSPQVSSSQDSGDSKQTVLERPIVNSNNGYGGENGYLQQDNGGLAGASGYTHQFIPQQQQPERTVNLQSPPKPTRPANVGPSSVEPLRQVRVQAEVANSAIPYSPPPPYVSTTPPKSRTATNSDIIKKELPAPEDKLLEGEEVVIEVRDSACQTRDSFLAQYRQLSSSPSSSAASSAYNYGKKAPLARSEALELFDTSTSMPSKRVTRVTKTPDSDVTVRSVQSTSSTGTDRMKTSIGSLEDIDEYQE